MLSKLDFEEKEKTSAQIKKERDEGKGGKVKKKKDKPVTMSLEQFNNLTVEQVTFHVPGPVSSGIHPTTMKVSTHFLVLEKC